MRNILVFLVVMVVCGCTTLDQYIPSMPTSTQSRGQTSSPQSGQLASSRPQVVRSQPAQKPIDSKTSSFMRSGSFPPVKVALLVPLSGEYQNLGKNLLDAAQLALFSVNEDNLILLPIDTKGTNAGTVDAANKAVAEGVKIILGPIFSSAAKAIAPIAREHNLSVISFSNDKTLANSGVFAIGFMPEQQIKRIAEFAMERGIRDFVTILPSDAYGETAAKELRTSVDTNAGASLLATEIFRVDPKTGHGIDLNEHVSLALNTALRTPSSKTQDQAVTFPRGMLIPEGGKQLEELTQSLTQLNHDPKQVQLLGNAQWYTPEALTNPALEGAWFAGPPSDRREQFERKFQSAYGYDPITLASLAYDGIALSATLARISNGTNFSREALVNPRGFVGLDGIFRFSSNGLSERGLAVMAIQGGRFKVVSPAPQNFFVVE